jgi:hypothetical protein
MKVKEKAAYFFKLGLHVNAGGWGNASRMFPEARSDFFVRGLMQINVDLR